MISPVKTLTGTAGEEALHAWTRPYVLPGISRGLFTASPRRGAAQDRFVPIRPALPACLAAAGGAAVGPCEAGHHVGLSGCQVRRWRKRWAAGEFSGADKMGRGRKAD